MSDKAAPESVLDADVLKNKGRRRRVAMSAVSGLLAALAFSTHSTGWLIWVAFVPWLYVLFSQPARTGSYAFYSWIFGMSFYIGVIHWLYELHPLTWLPGVTVPVSLAIVFGGIFGISLVVSLWTLGLGALLGWLKPTGWRRVVYPALLWMVMEYGQALGEISLPWARLAVSQYTNLWLLQIVPHTGQLVISGLILAFNAALALFILEFAPDPKPKAYWHYSGFKALVIVIGLVGANLIYGVSQLSAAPDPERDSEKGIFVGLAQGMIEQGQKWNSVDDYWSNMRKIEKIYLDLSHDLAKLKPDYQPGLLVWPESAIPVFPRHALEFQEHYKQLARETNSYFLTGGFDKLQPDDPLSPTYNAAALVEPGKSSIDQWYYKRQLVPFGEYFPYRAQLNAIPLLGGIIAQLNPMNSDTARGQTAGLFKTSFGELGTLICFESVYPQVARDSVREGAKMLVIITNDGWYRDAIALYQHLGHAVLRALENDRYVVRAGNTGITAFIDSYGRILSQTKPMERTSLYRSIPTDELKSTQSLYTRLGDWPIWLALLFMIVSELLAITMKPLED